MLSLTIVGTRELQDLARDLRRARGTLRSELTSAFRRAGEPTLRQVKRNMTSMDIKGYRTRGRPFTAQMPGTRIRARIARVTELEVRTGSNGPRVRFVVHTDRLRPGERKLPFHLDSGRRFRHPIMGFKKGTRTWKAGAASSGKPWFRRQINSDFKRFEAESERAIARTVQQIGRG